jgi:hypothetical protein
MHEQQQSDMPSSSASSSYALPPMSALPVSSKPVQYNPYPSSLSSSSRSPMYISNSQTNYPHSADRPMGSSYSSPNFTMRNPIRDEQRNHYSYSTSPYPSHDDTLQTPPAAAVSAPLHNQHRDTSLPYPSRRAMTEPQSNYSSVNTGFANLHLPSPQSIRLPSPPQGLQDSRSSNGSHLTSRHPYGTDGRISGMS